MTFRAPASFNPDVAVVIGTAFNNVVNALVSHWGIRPGSTQVWFSISLRET